MSKLRDEIASVIAEIADVEDPASITDEQHLYEDLGIDSMQALEIVLEMEKRLGLKIPENKLSTIKTLADAVKVARDCGAKD